MANNTAGLAVECATARISTQPGLISCTDRVWIRAGVQN